MKETRAWYLSRGIWGGVASIVAGIGMFFGVEVDAEELTETLMNLAGPLTAVAGGALSSFGRVKAKGEIARK